MFQASKLNVQTAEDYAMLNKQLEALLDGEQNAIANLANSSALLMQALSDINWAGFYLWETHSSQLVLGPFQGLPACVRIDSGKGVCGTAFERRQTMRVANVHQFPGHIACDAASQSEIVIPLVREGQAIGVLDIDSPSVNRFSEVDQAGLEAFVQTLMPFLEQWH
ncbi:GAF domain-containing protein [Marinicrinis sediminis]|uniref:GAF domain-containing protein n=1 Tax=Marinicrinis sediminis TaxID=1652465 RepID=A0ABW5REF7_9BACL